MLRTLTEHSDDQTEFAHHCGGGHGSNAAKRHKPDNLIPDPIVCAEFGVTAMTLWRWTRDPDLNFPPAIAIRNRNFRSRKQLEAFKARMLSKATRHRRVIDQQADDSDDPDQDRRPGNPG